MNMGELFQNKEDSSNLMMLPMEATESVEPSDGTEEIRRRKRSAPQSLSILVGVCINIKALYFVIVSEQIN